LLLDRNNIAGKHHQVRSMVTITELLALLLR